MTLAEAREGIGRGVVYHPGGIVGGQVEQGVITSVTDSFVFVRYGADMGSKATMPRDLEWLARPAVKDGAP